MTVVLIGESKYREFGLLAEEIEKRGEEPIMWEMPNWPSNIPVTFDVGSETIIIDDNFDINEIIGVFPWVHFMFNPLSPRFSDDFETNGRHNLITKLSQWRSVFCSFLSLVEYHGATVFYPPGTQQYDEWKPLRLEQFAKEGISIPSTTFTTDPERVREFVAEHSEVVYKPVVASAGPERLSESDLNEAPLERLSSAPVQFQEYIPGCDARVFFLDGKVVGASQYVTDEWTFKADYKVEDAKSVDLRDEVRQDVECAADILPMRFGAADLRLTEKTHALLEVNPAPRFAFHDLHGATNIASILADILIN